MSRSIRPSVRISHLAEGIQLDDSDTGFAVELEPEYALAMNNTGELSDALWAKLAEWGFTMPALDLKEIRRRQRKALDQSIPPLLERLQERFATIRTTVPFFLEKAAIYDPTRLRKIEDFTVIPYMRKKDLRENFPNGLIPAGIDVAKGIKEGSLRLVMTSGSTSDRLQVIARTETQRLPFGAEDFLGIPIRGQQPRTAIFTTPLCSGTECHLGISNFEKRISKTCPDLYLNSTNDPFSIQRDLLDSFCEDIERFQPTILMADAIYLQCIIRQANEWGIKLPQIPLIQYGFEFAHQAAVRDLKKAFHNSMVLNDYGASEENHLALQCHRGSLHVRSDLVHFEILGSSGSCPPGVVGAVAITSFDSLTPLIRYLIGDAAAWTHSKCDCEFSHWPTIELHGRLKDMIFYNGRWISTLDIDRAIGAPDWLDFYKIIELAPQTYEVQVIPSPGATVKFPDLKDRLSDLIDPKNIRFKVLSRFDPLPSLKIGLTQTCLSGAPELP